MVSQSASLGNWEMQILRSYPRPTEPETTTHSSVLAWRIPWTEEPGGLQSMGSHRFGHNWATKHITAHRPVKFEEENFLTTIELSVCTLLSQDIFNNYHLYYRFLSLPFLWPCCTACEILVLTKDHKHKQKCTPDWLPGNSLLFHFLKRENILRHNRRMQSFELVLSLWSNFSPVLIIHTYH